MLKFSLALSLCNLCTKFSMCCTKKSNKLTKDICSKSEESDLKNSPDPEEQRKILEAFQTFINRVIEEDEDESDNEYDSIATYDGRKKVISMEDTENFYNARSFHTTFTDSPSKACDEVEYGKQPDPEYSESKNMTLRDASSIGFDDEKLSRVLAFDYYIKELPKKRIRVNYRDVLLNKQEELGSLFQRVMRKIVNFLYKTFLIFFLFCKIIYHCIEFIASKYFFKVILFKIAVGIWIFVFTITFISDFTYLALNKLQIASCSNSKKKKEDYCCFRDYYEKACRYFERLYHRSIYS